LIDRIAIFGMGLLDTSTGLALRTAGFKGTIVGWNRSPQGAETALKMGAIDSIASDALQAAQQSQVVVLATPIFNILDWMEKLAPVLGPEDLLTDVGSTKGEITAKATALYNRPDRAGFLPGHPMAGKERGGADLGDAKLFEGAVWLFTDVPAWERSSASEALAKEWREWVLKMGSRTRDLDAARHDEMVAWVSHLPQYLSTSLSALLQDEIGDAPELKDVGGRALREMTRLGSSPYSMWRDIALTNTKAIELSLQKLEQRIAHLRENLRTPGLREEFEIANRFRKDA